MSAQPAAPARSRPASPATAGGTRPAKARLRIVRPARRRRRSRAPLLMLSGLVVAGLLVGIVTLQALVAQQSFRMQDLQERTRDLQLQYGELKARAAALSAPARVAAAARRQGMVLPDASQIQPLRVPGVATSSGGSTQPDAPPSAALKPIIGEEP